MLALSDGAGGSWDMKYRPVQEEITNADIYFPRNGAFFDQQSGY